MTPQELEDVTVVDAWIDAGVSQEFRDQPLALDFLRTCKVQEEEGESIAELVLASGGNARKGTDPAARCRLLAELADRAWTAILAIQHYTKDAEATDAVLAQGLEKIRGRVP